MVIIVERRRASLIRSLSSQLDASSLSLSFISFKTDFNIEISGATTKLS